jgi:hypothetical protein
VSPPSPAAQVKMTVESVLPAIQLPSKVKADTHVLLQFRIVQPMMTLIFAFIALQIILKV